MPFEMITMLGSTVLGGVMSIWSQSIKAKQAEQKMLYKEQKYNNGKVLKKLENITTKASNGPEEL